MMHLRKFYSIALFTMLAGGFWVAFLPGIAQAQAIGQQLAVIRDWAVFVGQDGSGKVCYVLSEPKDMEPKNVNRGDVLFYVTMRPSEGVANEVSVITGYTYQPGSQATVTIGENAFNLFTNENSAFVESTATEQSLVTAMRAGSTMVVRGTSSRGTKTVDQYSLFGISAALDRARQECS